MKPMANKMFMNGDISKLVVLDASSFGVETHHPSTLFASDILLCGAGSSRQPAPLSKRKATAPSVSRP